MTENVAARAIVDERRLGTTQLGAAERIQVGLAGIAVLLGCLLPVLHIGSHGFWIDELFTFHAIRLPMWDMCVERMQRGHSPFYFMLEKMVVLLAGTPTSEVPLRVLSNVSWTGAVLSFAWLSFRLLPLRTAALAVTIFSLGQTSLRWACIARMYSLLTLEVVWLTFAYLQMLRGGVTGKWRNVFVISSILATLTSPSYLLVVMGLVWDACFRREKRKALLTVILAPALIGLVLVFVPVLIFSIEANRTYVSPKKLKLLLPNTLMVFLGINKGEGFTATAVGNNAMHALGGSLIVAALGTMFWARRRLSSIELAAASVALIPLFLMLTSHYLAKLTRLPISVLGPDRYLFAAVPCGALFMAHMIARWASGAATRTLAIHLALCAMMGFGAFSIFTMKTEPFKESIQALAREYRTGDGLIVFPEEVIPGVEMYMPAAQVDATADRELSNPAEVSSLLNNLKTRERVWLVWYMGRRDLLDELTVEALGPYEIFHQTEKNLRIYLFHPKAGA